MSDHDIVVAGKCPPEPDELTEAAERGFDNIELYLERKHLEAFEKTVQNVRDTPVEVVSVHTPHVPIDTPEYLQKADNLAVEFDAYLVVHSNRIIHTHISALEDLEFQADYGYENNPGVSVQHVQHMILDQGHDFILDTAHLYMAEADYLEETAKLLQENPDQISVVHLCDSTLRKDGLGFGEGEMDMKRVVEIVKEEFDGVVVLEVMPDKQAEAKRKFEHWN